MSDLSYLRESESVCTAVKKLAEVEGIAFDVCMDQFIAAEEKREDARPAPEPNNPAPRKTGNGLLGPGVKEFRGKIG